MTQLALAYAAAPEQRGLLHCADGSAPRYLCAGAAVLTIESARTGARFTYAVTRRTFTDAPDRPRFFVALLRGPDNMTDYSYLGELHPTTLAVTLTKRSRCGDDAPALVALRAACRFMVRRIDAPSLRLWHEGACGACGRRLTVPASIASGIGPICAGRMA